MKTVIMDMSGNYNLLLEYFGENPGTNLTYLDFTGLQGTNILVDPYANRQISSAIDHLDPKGVHFLDSGNYHYLSYLWMKKIEDEFSLLLFDNHPDTTEPMEKGLLECGSWVREACENLNNLKQVYILGASKEHIDEASPLPSQAVIISDTSEIPEDLPLYISIDKDVLTTEYAATDWDQGKMSLEKLISQLHKINHANIIGVDICGEKKTQPTFYELELNHRTNLTLLEEIFSL